MQAISKPAAWHRFGSSDLDDTDDDNGSYFISAVCWKSDSPTMLTANSQGTIKVLVLAAWTVKEIIKLRLYYQLLELHPPPHPPHNLWGYLFVYNHHSYSFIAAHFLSRALTQSRTLYFCLLLNRWTAAFASVSYVTQRLKCILFLEFQLEL